MLKRKPRPEVTKLCALSAVFDYEFSKCETETNGMERHDVQASSGRKRIEPESLLCAIKCLCVFVDVSAFSMGRTHKGNGTHQHTILFVILKIPILLFIDCRCRLNASG